MVGKTISHYEILEHIGGGGMGVVYKARDLSLDRFVALKFLPPELTRDPDASERFVLEAKAASALDHPNICSIHEVGEYEGQTFIVMGYYGGETLRKKIERGPFPIEEAVTIAHQVAQGLAKAHEAGIVHRDIKPANIILAGDGIPKILDFGLAKVLGQALVTKVGTRLGTAAYMSPEQARGKETDHRTDIWSLGVLLYEMLTGKRPFGGDYESAVTYAILNEDPEPPRLLRPEIPPGLERTVLKALEKEPGERHNTVAEFAAELRSPDSGPPPRLRVSRKTMVAAGLGLLLVALVAAAVVFLMPRGSAYTSVAVLPFANPAADPELEYLCDGLCESLINSLSQLPDLKVKSLNSVMKFKNRAIDAQSAARELGAQAVLTGSATLRGGQLSIVMELVDASDNSHLWGDRWQRAPSELLSLQGELAHAVPEGLRIRLSPHERESLVKRYGTNKEAYQLYLKGRYHWNRRTPDNLRKAIGNFESALRLDPAYALAYSGLADCYNLLGSVEYSALPPTVAMPRAREAAERALQIDEELAEAHASLGHEKVFYEWDLPAAEREYRRALELNPAYATAHQWYGDWLMLSNRHDEALVERRKALDLDPLSLILSSTLGTAHYYRREYDRAIDLCRKTLELDPTFVMARMLLARAYVQMGRFDEAIAEFTIVRKAAPDLTLAAALLGHALAAAGRTSEAETILTTLRAGSGEGYVPAHAFAAIYLGLGRKDEALDWLQKAYEERSGLMVYLHLEPALDPLRSNPRFVELVRKVGVGRVN